MNRTLWKGRCYLYEELENVDIGTLLYNYTQHPQKTKLISVSALTNHIQLSYTRSKQQTPKIPTADREGPYNTGVSLCPNLAP
jgi:hypothetical protein